MDIGFSYFREFFRVLDVGGTMMIHLPVYQLPNETGKIAVLLNYLYSAFKQFDDIRSDVKRRLGKKIMRWTPYPISIFQRIFGSISDSRTLNGGSSPQYDKDNPTLSLLTGWMSDKPFRMLFLSTPTSTLLAVVLYWSSISVLFHHV